MPGRVLAVARDGDHRFSKTIVPTIRVIAGLGVEGDAHAGRTVQHRSRVVRDPTQPNLRQVHLIQAELLDELNARGFPIEPAMLGENITTRDVDLLSLPRGTRLWIGASALLEVTGLRNPCAQIEAFHPNLLSQVVGRDASGHVIRRSGIMAIAVNDGEIRTGDRILVLLPHEPHEPLDVV